MRSRTFRRGTTSWRLATIGLLTSTAAASMGQPASAAEPLWRQLIPRKRVEADANADYTLSDRNGPWLIMAASFHGEAGESDARALVYELRSRFNLPAYYYAMKFQRDDLNLGLGIDVYGGHIKRRYQSGDADVEHAVLVGDFAQIDDPDAQALLERIKTLEPNALKIDAGETATQSLAGVRDFYRQVKQQFGKTTTRGPMGHAFMTRNLLLPAEYFTAGVDPDVAKWNEGLDYSLLKCPGKYTIKVATFGGRATLSSGGDDQERKPRTRWAKDSDPLVIAGKNAHKLAVALREKGWEAYEFHDRHESYVTVGSFTDMQRLSDGRLTPATKDAQVIVNTFGAAMPNVGFERPAYEDLGMKPKDISTVEQEQRQIMQQFSAQFSAGIGQVAPGFHPKGFVGLPFDIHPQPIVAPKRSLGSQFVRN